jgi:hypothetical protein
MFRRRPREDEGEEIRAMMLFLMRMDAKLDALLQSAEGDDPDEAD